MSTYITKEYEKIPTAALIDALPENKPLYKDSGLWQIRSDGMEKVIHQQTADQTFRGFIISYLEWLSENEPELMSEVRLNLI